MGREFAGVLGMLAFSTVVARSFLVGAGFDGTVKLALMMMFVFAAVGYIAGSIAEQTVRESVFQTMQQSMDEEAERTSETT